MSDFTVRLFSRVRMGRGGSMDGLQSWSVDSATPITGFAPGHRVQLFPMLYAVVAVGTVAYVLWRLVGLLLEVDLERRRGVWTVLRFVLQLPILLVRLLIDRLFARIARPAQVSSSRRTHQSPRAKSNGRPGQTGSARAATVRRLFVLLLLWAKSKAPRTATQTAAEFARFGGRFPTVADDIAYVTDVYQSVRYSADRDDTPSPERMRASVRHRDRTGQLAGEGRSNFGQPCHRQWHRSPRLPNGHEASRTDSPSHPCTCYNGPGFQHLQAF